MLSLEFFSQIAVKSTAFFRNMQEFAAFSLCFCPCPVIFPASCQPPPGSCPPSIWPHQPAIIPQPTRNLALADNQPHPHPALCAPLADHTDSSMIR